MGVKSGGLERKSKAATEIPSSSMADIAFLLLIFFMVSTVFQNDRDPGIEWAQAEATEKMDEKQKDILNVWVESNGAVYINDLERTMDEVSDVVYPVFVGNPNLKISIRSDAGWWSKNHAALEEAFRAWLAESGRQGAAGTVR